MHEGTDVRTISLARPQKAILALLYVVFCFVWFVVVMALASGALLLVSRYG